jgi:membrane AbrB-like protein
VADALNARGLGFTVLAALAGGAAVGGIGAPAGWLSGAMPGVAALAALGRATLLPPLVQRAAIALAGVGMGSGLSPATLHTLARYPVSIVVMALALVAMTAASFMTLRRWKGFDVATAFYAAVPGALSYVFLVASRSPADLPRVAVIQVFRIFVLMALLPMVARVGVGSPLAAFAVDPLYMTLALVVVGAGLGEALARAGADNGLLYATIFVSGVAHGTGFAPGRLAPDMQIAAQTLIGAWVGTRFIGFDWRLLRSLSFARRDVVSRGVLDGGSVRRSFLAAHRRAVRRRARRLCARRAGGDDHDGLRARARSAVRRRASHRAIPDDKPCLAVGGAAA